MVTGGKQWDLIFPGSQFSVTLQQPPRVIGHTGELENKAVNEILRWIDFNKDVLLNGWPRACFSSTEPSQTLRRMSLLKSIHLRISFKVPFFNSPVCPMTLGGCWRVTVTENHLWCSQVIKSCQSTEMTSKSECSAKRMHWSWHSNDMAAKILFHHCYPLAFEWPFDKFQALSHEFQNRAYHCKLSKQPWKKMLCRRNDEKAGEVDEE